MCGIAGEVRDDGHLPDVSAVGRMVESALTSFELFKVMLGGRDLLDRHRGRRIIVETVPLDDPKPDLVGCLDKGKPQRSTQYAPRGHCARQLVRLQEAVDILDFDRDTGSQIAVHRVLRRDQWRKHATGMPPDAHTAILLVTNGGRFTSH